MPTLVKIPALRCPPGGFTLLELMVTLVVLSVILGLGVPSMRSIILNQRVRNAAMELDSALLFARSEATKRNNDVTITQAAGGWQNGWVTTNVADGSILQQHDPIGDVTVTANLSSVTYQHTGRVTAAGGAQFALNVTPSNGGVTQQCLDIGLSGAVSAYNVASSSSC